MQENIKKVENIESNIGNWRKRLIFRSWHRGMKEMDLLLGKFSDQYVQSFTEKQLGAFEDVLSINDPDLYKMYLKQREPTEEQNSDVLTQFLGYTLPISK
ncbi:MAG: succinate dehydrogenase assembly factor 2 [Alphaproteobacteria bacterium]|nr:succinate dehydrogenase assembly factor 2 [Alphaproteobacteria bacterium]